MTDRRCWRYRSGEAKIFESPEAVPDGQGWVDSPARVGVPPSPQPSLAQAPPSLPPAEPAGALPAPSLAPGAPSPQAVYSQLASAIGKAGGNTTFDLPEPPKKRGRKPKQPEQA